MTGAGGFAGGHLARACVEAGDDVVALSRSADEPATEGARAIAVDLMDRDAAARAVADAAPDVVFHLAAQASVPASWAAPGDTLRLNLAMTQHLLDAVRAHAPGARVVAVGSGEVYGPPAQLPVGEDAPLRPQNPYAVSKAAADLLAGMYADAHGLEVVRARPFNHAGPGQTDEYVVATLARQAAEGAGDGAGPLRIVTGNPAPRRDFTDVRAVADAYRRLASRDVAPGAYNVCSGHAVSVAELIELLGRVTGREIAHEIDPARVRAHEVMEIRGDPTRLRDATGWEPAIPLETTLADAVTWWRERRGR
ncbi:MAG TPA: GDP-mannose 4,6-dehydratase [Solirubrobacteraceae bacterium]|nr:GDP-mannose 4,6-dehydratase [Solirubrobacteraceae bacterium]